MNDITCPYCGHEQEVNHDDGFGCTEDITEEMECSECEKSFVFRTSIHFYYSPSKADCLNGSDHKYEKTFTSPVCATKWRCVDCDEELKKEIMAEYVKRSFTTQVGDDDDSQ